MSLMASGFTEPPHVTARLMFVQIVVGNSNNKFYLSRWVDVFLKHSKKINREYIQECLVGILQNNPQAIETTITPQEI